MLILTGYVDIAPSDIDEFCIDIERLTATAGTREGCLFYAVALERASLGRMLVSERWRDQHSLTAHLAAPDTAAFIQRWSHRMVGNIVKFHTMNERGLTDG
jgi:quinol monooxygenase YgiN